MKLGAVVVKCPHGCGEDIEVPVVVGPPVATGDGRTVTMDVTADVTEIRHECSGKKART